MSRIIQMPGRPLLKITITVDDKGQAQFLCDHAAHPAFVCKILSSCAVAAADMAMGVNREIKIEEGVQDNETEKPPAS